jgi:hypothetical protein
MCIDMKISNQANKDKRKAKYEMGNFCEQYGLPSVAPSRRHKTHKSHNYKNYDKRFKKFKKRSFEPNEYYKKNEHKSKSNLTNLSNKNLITINLNAISVENKDTLQKIARQKIPLSNSKSLMKTKKT